MKEKILRFTKAISLFAISICLALSINLGVWANDSDIPQNSIDGGEYTENYEENGYESGDITQNVFDQIYASAEENADKIFAGLAFLGTLVVGIGYKSGLLPLLRDALSKLKLAIDGVKADGELSKALTENKMAEISKAVEESNLRLANIEESLAEYEALRDEREKIKVLLEGQIDMLYAIFMSSSLPQYQKDEIGERIQTLREVLSNNEVCIEK